MIAPVAHGISRLRGTTGSRAGAVLLALLACLSSAADAQVGASVSLYNDYRFRGASLSDGQPAGILNVSYDLRDGAYAAATAGAVLTSDEGPRPLGFAVNAGYARRFGRDLTADLGIVHAQYSHYSGIPNSRAYTEFYAGLSGRTLSGRLSVSPDYLGSSRWTAYLEVDGHLDVSPTLVVDASAGAARTISPGYGTSGGVQLDGHVGLGKRLGPLTIHASIVSRIGKYLYQLRRAGRTALVFELSTAL